MSILKKWQLTEEELTLIVNNNPSLRGFMLGYIGEYKLQKLLLSGGVTALAKPDDHDRRKGNKNDLIALYNGQHFSFEVKSLQTNSIRYVDSLAMYTGRTQVDASDKRLILLPDGSQIVTTCLLAGEFDILAVNLFQFREEWLFAFALNRDLPRSRHRTYTEYQRQHLLATLVPITFPVQPPFVTNPFELLDRLIEERTNGL